MTITAPSTTSLEQFQTYEQRQFLDAIAQLRKYGLDTVISLPQLVLCGDQSAGKSSVLEALTEIPVPRNDNLCTRYATEFVMRRAPSEMLRMRIIPDEHRPSQEKVELAKFSETISDFDELPSIMNTAMEEMGLTRSSAADNPRAFSRDILSIEIEGPDRPQLTLVDIPGLIQTDTKGVTKQDLDIVNEITDFYIQQERTICLAVISATNDYANQAILTKVRRVDPTGERTLGIITKPDRLEPGSGSESSFISLARNEDIFFKLGWHVLKNRKFDEATFSIAERNASEAAFFRTSSFATLSPDCVGAPSLSLRLAGLLFDHSKREMPNLRKDLEVRLGAATAELDALGITRASATDCRNYLTSLSLNCLETTQAAMAGHYEAQYFQQATNDEFSVNSTTSIRRLRAVVQLLNHQFANTMRKRGQKYIILPHNVKNEAVEASASLENAESIQLSRDDALAWVSSVLTRCRGREPVGNYNPLVVGELFWEQASRWSQLASEHLGKVFHVCSVFLDQLLRDRCSHDVYSRLSTTVFLHALKSRNSNAVQELKKLEKDSEDFPAIYDQTHTDTMQKKRKERLKGAFISSVKGATSQEHIPGCNSTHPSTRIDMALAMESFQSSVNRDMEKFSCEEALDNLLSMYQSQAEVFIANVNNQVIERHIVRGLDKILSPLVVNAMTDDTVLRVAAEPSAVRRQREHLQDRVRKIEEGSDLFRGLMGIAI